MSRLEWSWYTEPIYSPMKSKEKKTSKHSKHINIKIEMKVQPLSGKNKTTPEGKIPDFYITVNYYLDREANKYELYTTNLERRCPFSIKKKYTLNGSTFLCYKLAYNEYE